MPPNKPTPSYRKLMDQQDWVRIGKELFLWTKAKYNSLPDDEILDFIAEARFKVYAQIREWDPQKGYSISTHLKWVIRNLIGHDKPDSATQNISIDVVVESGKDVADSATATIDEVMEQDEYREYILNLVKGDVDCEMILLAIFDGYYKPSEIAEEIGLPVEQVYNAFKRLKRKLINP